MVNFVATTHPSGQKRCRRGDACRITSCFYLRGEKSVFMRRMPCAMGKRDVGSDAPAEDSFLLWLYPDNYLRWKISHDPHAAGTDKGNLRDAGETCACQVII